MDEQPPKKNLANELARERSREAAHRTLMAWVRTTLSLIGFGFAIANFRANSSERRAGEQPSRKC